MDDSELTENDTVKIPVTDEIDLHHFRPKEIKNLLDDYFNACLEEKIMSVRVIHGKGSGAMRRTVESFIASSSLVKSYKYPADGNWGATLVELENSVSS